MRRAVLPWIAAALILVGGSIGAIAVADVTLFSAGAFVRVYLDAVARGDARAAASVPGVSTRALGRDAIASSAMPTLSGVRQVSDRTDARGRHRVTIGWTSRGATGRTTFLIESAGTRLLVFPAWRFAASPIARLDASPRGDVRFRIGRLDTVAGRSIALLVPGAYRVDMDGPVATAPPVDVIAARPGSRLTAEPKGLATDTFEAAVDRAVRRAVETCARSTALYPAGCPFGAEVTDRITSTPAWRISRVPTATVEPTATPGVWRATLDGGVAVVRVDVRSLFDGTVSSRTIDAPITGAYRVVVDDDRPVLSGLESGNGADDGG